jgi:ribosomal protein S18 acetylase RimI-like enzyme
VPTASDRGQIRSLLEKDRAWSLYALGDLQPGYFEHCRWFAASGSVALIYRAVDPPVLFAHGSLDALLPEIVPELPECYLHVRPEALAAIARQFRISWQRDMWRMVLDPASYRPAPCTAAVRLGPPDLDAVRRLYTEGEPAGEAPDFFFPSMLEQVFFGVRQGEELAAVAGTHLVARGESVAAVGNVYTRRDCRGRGLAAACTSAVVDELLRLGIRTVGLNVVQANSAAIRIYERLGFVRHCAFCEGLAVQRAGPRA